MFFGTTTAVPLWGPVALIGCGFFAVLALGLALHRMDASSATKEFGLDVRDRRAVYMIALRSRCVFAIHSILRPMLRI